MKHKENLTLHQKSLRALFHAPLQLCCGSKFLWVKNFLNQFDFYDNGINNFIEYYTKENENQTGLKNCI